MERGKKNEKYEFSPSSHLEEIGFWEKSFLSFAERPILRRRPRRAAVAEPRAGARCARGPIGSSERGRTRGAGPKARKEPKRAERGARSNWTTGKRRDWLVSRDVQSGLEAGGFQGKFSWRPRAGVGERKPPAPGMPCRLRDARAALDFSFLRPPSSTSQFNRGLCPLNAGPPWNSAENRPELNKTRRATLGIPRE